MPPVLGGRRRRAALTVEAGFFLTPPGPKDMVESPVDDES